MMSRAFHAKITLPKIFGSISNVEGLNPQQQAAVQYIDGPMLVLAGAGSGKTRVITYKIAHLIQVCGIKPQNITAVTFTNKAAREMKARVKEILGGREARGLKVSTFHTFGLNILRREHGRLGYKTGFTIFDAQDSLGILKDVFSAESDSNVDDAAEAQWQISRWKNDFLTPEQALSVSQDENQARYAGLYAQYQRKLKAYNGVDFDDLIMLPVLLFQQQPEVLESWQRRIHYLLVDEYQDTNASQYRLIKLLLGLRARLTAVGDDDQSIYAWRGARPENISLLVKDFPSLKVVKLEQNYRSTGRILNCANRLISHNPHEHPKRLWSDSGYGEPVKVIECSNAEDEADRVAIEINSHRFHNRTAFKDYAILYRGNHQSRIFEKYLRQYRIPYVLSGGTSFFERSEVKHIMAYFRLLANPDDDAAFLRAVNTPKRSIGSTTLEKLGDYATKRGVSMLAASFELGVREILTDTALNRLLRFTEWLVQVSDNAQRGDPAAVARELVRDIGYEVWMKEQSKDPKTAERRMENVRELLDWLERLSKDEKYESIGNMVAQMSLMDILERNQEEQDVDGVYLMTFHAAKGLEFPYVFMVGVEEDALPHHSSADGEMLEEERRLAYVGITRARKELTITMARKRQRYGEDIECEPSRFLRELPEEDLEWEGENCKRDEAGSKQRGRAQLAGLKAMLG